MPANGKKENLLSSWKEIAAYLDRDVRTCVRWEKQFGLPVHRLEKESKGKVFAFTDEIDRWLASRAENLTSEGSKSPPRRRLWLFGLALAAILLGWGIFRWTGFIPGGRGAARRVPTEFRIQGSTLIILDQEGRDLGRFETRREGLEPEAVYRNHFQTKTYTDEWQPVWPYIMLCDVNGDGQRETLFSLQTKDELNEGILYCLDEKGKELWHFETGRELAFGGKSYRREYRIFGFDVADVNADGKLEVLILSVQRPDWPCQFAVLNAAGRCQQEFWNCGHLADLCLGDIDGDGRNELVLSGVNNEYETGCAVIFKTGHIGGSSPQDDPQFRSPDLTPGTETAYLLFPTSDAVRAMRKEGDPANYVWLHAGNGFSVMSRVSHIYYDFDARLDCTNVTLSHIFEDLYFDLYQKGRLSRPLVKPAYEQKLADAIRIFQDGKWRGCRRLF